LEGYKMIDIEDHEPLPHPEPGPRGAIVTAMNTPKAANDNRESRQIDDPYMDAMIDQSWKNLGKAMAPKPNLTLVPKPNR